jgi:RNA polymerase sigma-70 factor (family 1)
MSKESNIPASENLNLLIEQLRKGSQVAFTRLYDRFSRPLFRNILRLVKDEEVTEELLQDLFLKIWIQREGIDINKSFKSYLYKVAENLVYEHFRKVAKNDRLIVKLVLSSINFEPNVEDAIIAKENHELLRLAIDKLPPQRKQIFTLCKLDGKSYEEVSQQLGISTSTISNQIVSANKSIKKYFMQNGDVTAMVIISQVLLHRM